MNLFKVMVGVATIFILLSVISQTPVGAVGVGISPAKIDLGTIGRGGSAQENVTIFNIDNSTAMSYNATVQNITGMTVSPSSGIIQAKGNETLILTLNVLANATNGKHNGTLTVNGSTPSNFGGAVLLPAVAAKISYTVSGNATPSPQTTSQGFDYGLLIGALVLVLIVGAMVSWLILRRRT
jgi:hypothetical protein